MANLIITYWRDIPSAVSVKAGRKEEKRMLADRFQARMNSVVATVTPPTTMYQYATTWSDIQITISVGSGSSAPKVCRVSSQITAHRLPGGGGGGGAGDGTTGAPGKGGGSGNGSLDQCAGL